MKWYRNAKHLTSTFFRNNNKKNKSVSIKTTPSKVDIETFWSSIWTKSSTHNENTTGLKTLEDNYCKNKTPKPYQINVSFKGILKSMKNKGAPGPDKINAYVIKKLSSKHLSTKCICRRF